MTTVMNQVTCSLCNIKIDELEGMYHLVSTNHLQLCTNDKDKFAIKFFETLFNTYSKKSGIYNLKIEKHLISGNHISQQNYPKKNLVYYVAIQSFIQN